MALTQLDAENLLRMIGDKTVNQLMEHGCIEAVRMLTLIANDEVDHSQTNDRFRVRFTTRGHNKVVAIKAWRAATNQGLIQAKTAIEEIDATQNLFNVDHEYVVPFTCSFDEAVAVRDNIIAGSTASYPVTATIEPA